MQGYGFKHTRTGDFRLNYHMVWTTGFNRPILEGEVGEFLTTQIEVECQKLKIEVEDACVDLVLTLPTDVTVSQVLKNIKGLSAQQTFKKYPELKDKR